MTGCTSRRNDELLMLARVVMVLQEPVRWPHDARPNIRVGRYNQDDPDDVRLLAAADHARAQTVIESLPDRWRTLLSRQFRGGRDLSGGQWQRIAVARGLFRDAPLLIWDEPTAPLDAKAEHAVYESLQRVAVGRTVILITHRLASVRDVDRIFVLDRGRIIEDGTHGELMAKNGEYAALYSLQAQMYVESGHPGRTPEVDPGLPVNN
jgi:ABC-type multidrug transport system fused ATPase/permease subunit